MVIDVFVSPSSDLDIFTRLANVVHYLLNILFLLHFVVAYDTIALPERNNRREADFIVEGDKSEQN